MNKKTTLRGIVRVNIKDIIDNKFWLVDKWADICDDKNKYNELLDDDVIKKGISDGSISTTNAIKRHEILVNESEFFRIVEHLNPLCVVDDGRGYDLIKDIIEVKIGRYYNTYATLFDDDAEANNAKGIIYVNGRRFKKIFCSASHVRQKKAFFVAEELYDKVNKIALAGIDIDNDNNVKEPCKWGAYMGMCCTDSQVVKMPQVVVIPDYEQAITERFDVVTGKVVKNNAKDKKGVNYLYQLDTQPQNNALKTIKIKPFDGAGLVDVSLAAQWAKDLNLNYIPSAWQFRAMAGVKGNVYTFDIREFADTYNVSTIIDAWGKKHEIFNKKHELKINCIFTNSQIKFSKMFNSAAEWQDAFHEKEYGYSRTFNVSDASISYKKLKPKCVLSYQPLQSLELTDDEIKALCSKTIDSVKRIHTDIDNYINWSGLDYAESKDERSAYVNPALVALKYNHALASDSYIHKVIMETLRRYRTLNHIHLGMAGNYEVFIPDLFALAQASFGLPVNGLLKAGQIYNKYWHDRDASELTMIRFPHVAREHYLAKVANENDDKWDDMCHWYKYQDVGYVSSINDSLALRLGGADYDNDHIYGIADKTICDAVKRNPANTIYFDRDDAGEAKANKKIKFNDYTEIAKSDYIGMKNEIGNVVDMTSKLWGIISPDNTAEQNDKIYDYIKVMSVIDSLTIDFAKTGIKAQMPKAIKDALGTYHNPYFFRFRSTEEAGKAVQAEQQKAKNKTDVKEKYTDTKSTMNRIAHYMDGNISNLKGDYNTMPFDWTSLLQGEYDDINSDTYKAILATLRELQAGYYRQIGGISKEANNNLCSDDGRDNGKISLMQMRLIFADCRIVLLQKQPDINKLINDVVIAYYTDKTLINKSKLILWYCFAAQMITRAKGNKSRGKIYNVEELQKRHDKIVKAKHAEELYKAKQINLPMIDEIKKKVSITDADKKYINKTLDTQRSKKLYYALLYIWLKLKTKNSDLKYIDVKNNVNNAICASQVCLVAGIQRNAWTDALASLRKHELITTESIDCNTTRVYIGYERHDGNAIDLPKKCVQMRHWINRYAPAKAHRHEAAETYSITDGSEAKSRRKSVKCIDTGEIYASARDAWKATDINYDSIRSACAGKAKSAGGKHWTYC